MTSQQKIYKIIKEIKEKSEISPDKDWVEFNFNDSCFGVGFLGGEEERNILLKLKKEKIIELHSSSKLKSRIDQLTQAPSPSSIIYTVEELKNKYSVWVQILDGFDIFFKKYKNEDIENKIFINKLWVYSNPFWITWKLILIITKVLKLIFKHKLISLIIIIISFLAIDFSMAWKNINWTIGFIKNIF